MFQVQANNYATFYDDQMQNWSLMFESCGDATEFAKEVSRAEIFRGTIHCLFAYLLSEDCNVSGGPGPFKCTGGAG